MENEKLQMTRRQQAMNKRMIIVMLTTVIVLSLSACVTERERNLYAENYSSFNIVDGVYHGIETYASLPYVFVGEWTGKRILNDIDGHYYAEVHVLDRIRGETKEYILMYNHYLYGDTKEHRFDFPFKDGEQYLFMTSKAAEVYHGEYFYQGWLYCPVNSYKDAFMDVLGEGKSLDFMTKGTKKNFKTYDSFLAYIKRLLEETEPQKKTGLYYTESDDIYTILTESPQILKVKVIYKGENLRNGPDSHYMCRVEKVYKGDYDLERGCLIELSRNGETAIRKPSNDYKHYFGFRLFDADIDIEKTDEYIICNNSVCLIARKGVISLDYTEEEIIQMLEDIYGEVSVIEIPEEAAYRPGYDIG